MLKIIFSNFLNLFFLFKIVEENIFLETNFIRNKTLSCLIFTTEKKNVYIKIYIYIYIYIVIQRHTVSLYHNSSVWLHIWDASNWY